MKRLLVLITGLALLAPAAASARTPVLGGLKQTIVQSFAQSQSYQLNVTPRQVSACFSVYTDDSYAYVSGGAGHQSWYRQGGLCDIQVHFSGQVSQWQPVNGLLRHETGGWRALLTFDQIEPSQLRHLGIPLAVFENLANTKPPNYPFVPSVASAAQPRLSGDAVRSCKAPPYGHGMGNDPGAGLGDISARNMSCQTAVRAIQNGRLTAQGFFTSGFACHTLATAKYGGGTIRCTHDAEAFRFTWGT
jgi:hypothetical protein